MREPKITTTTGTGRYYLRIPEETIAEIRGYIKESGMHPTHFLSNALVVGARQLAHSMASHGVTEEDWSEQ